MRFASLKWSVSWACYDVFYNRNQITVHLHRQYTHSQTPLIHCSFTTEVINVSKTNVNVIYFTFIFIKYCLNAQSKVRKTITKLAILIDKKQVLRILPCIACPLYLFVVKLNKI